jgi:hypothetical protein
VGTLGLSAIVDLTRLFVTHVSILTPDTSSLHPGRPSMVYRTLCYPSPLFCLQSARHKDSTIRDADRRNCVDIRHDTEGSRRFGGQLSLATSLAPLG